MTRHRSDFVTAWDILKTCQPWASKSKISSRANLSHTKATERIKLHVKAGHLEEVREVTRGPGKLVYKLTPSGYEFLRNIEEMVEMEQLIVKGLEIPIIKIEGPAVS